MDLTVEGSRTASSAALGRWHHRTLTVYRRLILRCLDDRALGSPPDPTASGAVVHNRVKLRIRRRINTLQKTKEV